MSEEVKADTKQYRTGAHRYYDSTTGKLYEPGEVVSIPAHQKPSKTWFHLDGTPVQVEAPKTVDQLDEEEAKLIAELRAKKAGKAAQAAAPKPPAPPPAKPPAPGRPSDKDAI